MKETSTIMAVVLIGPATILIASGSEEAVSSLVNTTIATVQEKGQDYSYKTFKCACAEELSTTASWTH
jgi:N-acetylglucosamine kinase-like BadF-type ATPase